MHFFCNICLDPDGSLNYETHSIIYKFLDDKLFMPFQSIQLTAAMQWLPIMVCDIYNLFYKYYSNNCLVNDFFIDRFPNILILLFK